MKVNGIKIVSSVRESLADHSLKFDTDSIKFDTDSAKSDTISIKYPIFYSLLYLI